MRCPECRSTIVNERPERTAQGYRRFRCLDYAKQLTEPSAGLLNRTQYPSDVIALVVLWRLHYKLSLQDLAEMFRGFVFSHETVRDWEPKLTPALAEDLRRRQKGKVGRSRCADETYIRLHGCWRYPYRAIDRDGALVDVMLSEHRDLAAAKTFFWSGVMPVTTLGGRRVTTDGPDAYSRAIRTELGKRVRHRANRYLNNRLEQDHRGIKVPLSTDAWLQEHPVSQAILPRPRRTPKLPALPVPHAPTRSGGDAALSPHAPNGDCTRPPGGRQTGLDSLPWTSVKARKLTEP